MKTIAAVADDLLGSATGAAPAEEASSEVPRVARIRRIQDLSVIGVVAATEAAWVGFLCYELWFRLL